MSTPRPRDELFPQKLARPEPIDFDYSGDITDADITAMKNAQPNGFDKGGILISGEEW